MRILISALMVLAGTMAGAQDLLPPEPAKPTHVSITTSADVKTAAAGQKIALYADVTPKPRIHVYAPGAEDYQPIKLTLDAQNGITAGALKYPKSELMVNEFERVPVFQKPFRLVQEVVVGARGAVTITGTVTYQACDDRVCFKPESIPVNWSVAIK